MLDVELIAAREKGPGALMVVLHGLGDSTTGYRWLPEALGLSWMNYLLVNAPDPYFGGFSWYDFAGDANPGIVRSRKLLFQLLDHHRAQGFVSAQTTLFGFSQGCLMTVDVGLRYPHLLAGCVGISGYVHDPDRALAELSPVAAMQRFLITHGTMDPMIPCKDVRGQINLLKSSGLQMDWHEFDKAHTIAGEVELTLIRSFVKAGYPAMS